MRIVVTATGMMVVKGIDMVVIYIPPPRSIKRIVRRVIAPVVRRVPCYPSRTPEPVVDNGTVQINRFNNIVLTINVSITYHLHGDRLVLFALHINGCHVLVNIFRQHCLKNDKAVLSLAHFYDADIVHIAVAVKVKVIQVAFLRIKFLLKLFEVVHFTKQSCYGTKVEALRNVLIGRRNSYCLIGAG